MTSSFHLLGWGKLHKTLKSEWSYEEQEKAASNSLSAYSLANISKNCPNTSSLETSLLKVMSMHLYRGLVDDFCSVYVLV